MEVKSILGGLLVLFISLFMFACSNHSSENSIRDLVYQQLLVNQILVNKHP